MKKNLLPIAFILIGYAAATIVTMSKVFSTMDLTRLANFYFLGIIPLLLLVGLGAYIYATYKQVFTSTKEIKSNLQEYINLKPETENTQSKIIEPFDIEKYQTMKSKLIEEISTNPQKSAELLEDYVKGHSS